MSGLSTKNEYLPDDFAFLGTGDTFTLDNFTFTRSDDLYQNSQTLTHAAGVLLGVDCKSARRSNGILAPRSVQMMAPMCQPLRRPVLTVADLIAAAPSPLAVPRSHCWCRTARSDIGKRCSSGTGTIQTPNRLNTPPSPLMCLAVSLSWRPSALSPLPSSEAASRAVSPASRFLPASRNSFDQR